MVQKGEWERTEGNVGAEAPFFRGVDAALKGRSSTVA